MDVLIFQEEGEISVRESTSLWPIKEIKFNDDLKLEWPSPFTFSETPDPAEFSIFSEPKIKIARAHEDGKFPTRNEGDAGFDLFLRDCKGEPSPTGAWTIRPGHRKVFCVGIKTEFPNDMVCNIRPRSGLAVNHGIDVMAGVVDPRYRGEICVCLINHGDKSYTFEKGQRIAQMVFHKIETDHEQVEFLSDSDRGDSGFGSTGK